MVVEYTEEAVGRLAFRWPRSCAAPQPPTRPLRSTKPSERIRELDEDVRLGPVPAQSSTRPSPGHSVPEAYRGQPGAAGLGQSPTSHPGSGNRPQQRDCGIDRAGQGTHQGLLHAAGVPVPKGRPVDDVVDAWAAACEIGLPVVVKPRDGNQGKGRHRQHRKPRAP